MFSVRPSVLLSVRLSVTNLCNELTEFAANLHTWSTMKWNEMVDFWGQVRGEGHTTLKLVLEIRQRHLSRSLRSNRFLSHVSILKRDIDIANLSVCLSVRNVPVSDENGLTYRHSYFHHTVANHSSFTSIKHLYEIPTESPPAVALNTGGV